MKRCFTSFAAALLVLLGGLSARAATNVVTALADSGPGSLRMALAEALPGDAITFATNGTLTLTSGELVITTPLSIHGPGRTNLALNGNNSSRVLRIHADVLISGLTIRNGRTPGGANGLIYTNYPNNNAGHSESGGGILNGATLTMLDCALNSNVTGPGGLGGGYNSGITGGRGGNAGHGGAICNQGTLLLTNCSLTGNSAGSGGPAGFNGITYGRGGDAGHGGAIYGGSITLHGCTFTGNAAGAGGFGGANTGGFGPGGGGMAGRGGAIYGGGILLMMDCTLNGNTGRPGGRSSDGGNAAEGGRGGGLFNPGTATIQNCLFLGNTAGDGGQGGFVAAAGGGGQGGAIYNEGLLTLNSSTVSGNWTGQGGTALQSGQPGGRGGDGGGLCNAGTLAITNSTLSDNACKLGGQGYPQGLMGNGGGISTGGPLSVNSSTISSNRLGSPLTSYIYQRPPGYGGGIYSAAISPPQLVNTLVAGNFCSYQSNVTIVRFEDDVFGSFSSQGHNLVGITNRSAGFIASNDLVGSLAGPLDARLGPLADNGGPSFTHALLPGSPALDTGDDTVAAALATDQRGSPRFSGPQVDIGAFEWLQPQLTEPGGSNGAFGFVLRGAAGSNYVIQVSSNLVTWHPFLTNTIPGEGRVPISDPSLTNLPMRFYRAVPQ